MVFVLLVPCVIVMLFTEVESELADCDRRHRTVERRSLPTEPVEQGTQSMASVGWRSVRPKELRELSSGEDRVGSHRDDKHGEKGKGLVGADVQIAGGNLACAHGMNAQHGVLSVA